MTLVDTLTIIGTFLGVGVATVTVVIIRLNAVETNRRQEEANRRQEVGVDQWMRDLRDWASKAIEVLSEAVYASDSSDVRRYIFQLSALVDRGRFFLPNPVNEEDELEKLPAFQGSRHRALVPLITALRVLDGEVENNLTEYVSKNRSDVIRELQREFVSHIQQILDPRKRNREIAELIQQSDEQVKALEGGAGTGAKARLRDVVKRLREKD
jgi:hypothetical protein